MWALHVGLSFKQMNGIGWSQERDYNPYEIAAQIVRYYPARLSETRQLCARIIMLFVYTLNDYGSSRAANVFRDALIMKLQREYAGEFEQIPGLTEKERLIGQQLSYRFPRSVAALRNIYVAIEQMTQC